MKTHVRSIVLFVVLAFILYGFRAIPYVSAQQKSACPTTKITCPDMVNINDRLQFIADVRGGDANVTPTYNWTVSAGTIESGQGTSVIQVNTMGLSDNESVTATVELGGFSRDCGYGQVAASCTSSLSKKPEARKLDEYGSLTQKEENERLDNFTIELQMDPTAQAYIIAYGGRAGRSGDAQRAATKVKSYLVTKRGMDPSRIMTVDGGYREHPAIELWLVPSRAQLPKPTPTVKRS